MRRAIIAVGGTVAGLAALLSFKTHSAVSGLTAEGTPAMSAPTSASAGSGAVASAVPGASRSGSGKAGSAGAGSTGSTSPKAGTDATAVRTITGAAASTQYGPMQVKVTLTGTRITGVTVVQQTNLGSTSTQIDSFAIPQLNKETLAAQSARIDAVSGASYTSAGYIQSLQSALDQAG